MSTILGCECHEVDGQHAAWCPAHPSNNKKPMPAVKSDAPAMDIESIVKQTECNTIGIEGKKHDPNFCTRCQLESYATSQRELRKGLPKPENMKWLLDAANQVISELSKQEHLDSETFRWLCNAVGQVERDLKRSAILEGKV